jgi:hypothetical protein
MRAGKEKWTTGITVEGQGRERKLASISQVSRIGVADQTKMKKNLKLL